MTEEKGLQISSQILIYQAEDGQTKIEVQLQEETVWLAQKHMAELFQTSKQNIGQHLKNIFAEGELKQNSVVKKFFTTAADGKKYQTLFYNLDAIISVGSRIKSHTASISPFIPTAKPYQTTPSIRLKAWTFFPKLRCVVIF